MNTVEDSRWMGGREELEYKGPCHLHRTPRLRPGTQLLFGPAPTLGGTERVNQKVEGVCLSGSLPPK